MQAGSDVVVGVGLRMKDRRRNIGGGVVLRNCWVILT